MSALRKLENSIVRGAIGSRGLRGYRKARRDKRVAAERAVRETRNKAWALSRVFPWIKRTVKAWL